MTRSVLVVDDDSRVRAAVRDILATTADLSVAAESGTVAQALEALRGGADVALVDVSLPAPATGLALIAALSRRLPVIAVSVSGAARPAAVAAGAVAFLDKDGDPDALLSALRTVRYATAGTESSSAPPGTAEQCLR